MADSGMVSPAFLEQIAQLQLETPCIKPSMTAREQDLDLVQRMASGDENAMREVYAAYGQRLFAYALRLTNDPVAAEDVTQETLVIAWRTAGTFRGEGRLLSWLLGIAHHTAMKALRHTAQPLETIEETVREKNGSPEDAAQAEDMKHCIRTALQELSTEHRAVIELVFYQGLSLDEVAQVCRCPLGTVKSRLNYARTRLRGVLSRAGEVWP